VVVAVLAVVAALADAVEPQALHLAWRRDWMPMLQAFLKYRQLEAPPHPQRARLPLVEFPVVRLLLQVKRVGAAVVAVLQPHPKALRLRQRVC
jgi:hypothetical protein